MVATVHQGYLYIIFFKLSTFIDKEKVFRVKIIPIELLPTLLVR